MISCAIRPGRFRTRHGSMSTRTASTFSSPIIRTCQSCRRRWLRTWWGSMIITTTPRLVVRSVGDAAARAWGQQTWNMKRDVFGAKQKSSSPTSRGSEGRTNQEGNHKHRENYHETLTSCNLRYSTHLLYRGGYHLKLSRDSQPQTSDGGFLREG